MKSILSDYLVIGGGAIGLSIARSLSSKFPTASVTLIEKEKETGMHGSLHNSGVLHAGIYYSTDSFRAKYSVLGNAMLTEYHKQNNIPLLNCGKLIIAKNKAEAERIPKLYKQGITNGVKLELLDVGQALKLEPHLKVHGDYPIIWSPNTSVGTPKIYIKKLTEEAKTLKNLKIINGSGYKSIVSNTPENIAIKDQNGQVYETRFLINCAGLYADKVAHDFDVAKNLTLVPLTGIFLIDDTKNDVRQLNTLVYPVPPASTVKGNYFLGIHTTLTTEGKIKLGPTALPGLWREHYGGFQNMNGREFLELMKLYLRIGLSRNCGFYLKMLLKEIKKHYSPNIVEEVKSLVTIYDNIKKNFLGQNVVKDVFHFSQGGIRTQLINTDTFELINDFIIIQNKNQLHYLNMISPGWTSSLAIGDDIQRLVTVKCENTQSSIKGTTSKAV